MSGATGFSQKTGMPASTPRQHEARVGVGGRRDDQAVDPGGEHRVHVTGAADPEGIRRRAGPARVRVGHDDIGRSDGSHQVLRVQRTDAPDARYPDPH